MYDVKVFSFDGHPVRVVDDGCDAWFVLQDVCNVLGIKSAANVCRRALRNEEKRSYVIPVSQRHRSGGSIRTVRKMLTTNESGIYALIMRSDKPEAIGFRYWVTSEVLPAIMRTGIYELKQGPEKNIEPQTEKVELFASGLQATLTISGNFQEVAGILKRLQY